MQQRGRGGNSWIGWVIFVFLVFGSRLLPPVAVWLSQATGLAITAPMLVAVVIGLSVLGSVVGSAVRSVGKAHASSELRPPTPTMLPPPSGMPPPRPVRPARMSQLPPPTGANPLPGMPSGQPPLLGPPRFEPIIHPRVLAFGIIGLVVFGGLFLAAVLFAGALP